MADTNPFILKDDSNPFVLKNTSQPARSITENEEPNKEFEVPSHLKHLELMAKGAQFTKDAAETARVFAGGALSGMAAVGPAAMNFLGRGNLQGAAQTQNTLMESQGPQSDNPMTQSVMHGMDYAFREVPGRAAVGAVAAVPFVGQGLANKYENEIQMGGEIAGQFLPAEAAVTKGLGAAFGRTPRAPRPPTPEEAVIQRARERAQEQGRTTVTADDIRAAEGYKYEGGIDYPGPDLTNEPMPQRQQPPQEGLPFPGKLELEDSRLGPVQPSARDRFASFDEPPNPFVPQPSTRAPRTPKDIAQPAAYTRLQREQAPGPINYERGVGIQGEMDFQSRNYPQQEYTVGGVPAKGVVPTDRQPYVPPSQEMVNQGAVQGEMSLYKTPGPEDMGAVKDPGGNWRNEARQELRDALMLWPEGAHREDRVRMRDSEPRVQDLIEWSERAATQYLNRYAGTERDPLRNIEIPYADGTARWEDITDATIAARAAKNYRKYGENVDSRIHDEAPIWDINRNSRAYVTTSSGRGMLSGAATEALYDYLNHVRDYLQFERQLSFDELKRYDFVRAVRETAEWDRRNAAKATKEREQAAKRGMKDATVYKEYPDGWKWIKLDKPGQFAAESKMMGHSVAGYEPPRYREADIQMRGNWDPHPDWIEASGDRGHPHYGLGGWDAIKSGDAQIFSLRDPKGVAHVTIEVQRAGEQSRLGQYSIDEARKRGVDPWEPAIPDIRQIKGQGNRAPSQAVLGKVQDFVKSREWGEVGDSGNANMQRVSSYAYREAVIENGMALTPENQKLQTERAIKHFGGDKYITRDEWLDFIQERKDSAISTRVADAFDQKDLVGTNDKYVSDLANLTESGNFRGALEHISNTSPNKFYRWLSDALLLDNKFNPKLVVYDQVRVDNKPVVASYSNKMKEVQLSRGGAWHGSEWALLHEAVHARLADLQWRQMHGLPIPESVRPYIRNINSLYKWIASQLNETQLEIYGFKNELEFLAEGFTNPDFQKVLEDFTIPADIFQMKKETGLISAWTAFIDQVASIFRNMGFKKFTTDAKTTSALAVLLNEGSGALRAVGFDPKVARLAYGPEGMQWADKLGAEFKLPPKPRKAEKPEMTPFSVFRDQLSTKEGKVFADKYSNALYEEYRKEYHAANSELPRPMGYDNRGHDAVKNDLYRKDGKPRLDDVGYIFPISPAFTQAETHPVLRRIYDQVSQATVEKANQFNQWWHGAQIIDKGGFNPMKMRFTTMSTIKRTEHPDSLSVLSSNMSKAEGQKVLDLINQYGETDPKALTDATLLKANGASERTIKFLRTLDKVMDDILTAVNKVRADKGLEAIKKNEAFWITKVRYGAYQVFAHDAEGRHTYLGGFNTMADAEKVASYLRNEKRMNVAAALAEHNPRHFDLIPSDVFMQAANMLPDAAQRKALREAAEEAVKRVGVNRYALPRDSKIGGYVGSQELIDSLGGGKAWESAKSSIETYVRQASNYVATHEYGKRVGEMFMDQDIKRDYPNAMDKGRFMWDMFVGVPRPMDELLRDVSKRIGAATGKIPGLGNFIDERTGHALVSGAGNYFTAMKLVWWNPAFYLANAIQNFAVYPRLYELNGEYGGKGNVYEAMLRAEQHMSFPTEYSKQIMMEAMENGSLEARFAEALDWVQTKSKMPIAVKYIMGEQVAAWADSYSRGKAYISMFEFGKSLGLKDKEAHSFAAREAQGIMIQYDRWARMPVLNKLGPVGDAIAPVTTYTTNTLFNLARYMKDTVRGPQNTHLIAPLLSSLSIQLALGGIRGMPFYEDLEAMYLMVAKQYIEQWGGSSDDFTLPSEWLSKVPSVLQDGVFSELTGVNMTGALGMGTVGSTAGQMAGISYAQDVIGGFYELAEGQLTGRSTRQQRFETGSKLLPPLSKELLRSVIDERSPLEPASVKTTKDGELTTRTKGEQLGALLTGRTPTREAEIKRGKHQMTTIEDSVKNAKEQARDKMVDAVLSDRPVGRFVENVMTNYPEIFEGLDDAIENRIMKMYIPWEQRQVLKNKANYRLLELQRRAFENKKNYERK